MLFQYGTVKCDIELIEKVPGVEICAFSHAQMIILNLKIFSFCIFGFRVIA